MPRKKHANKERLEDPQTSLSQGEHSYTKELEQKLRQAEEKYQTLFDSIDEGFCIIEVLFDASGSPIDYRFLEVNASFEQQTGIKNAVGRRMRDIAPEHEDYWFEIYGKIALTGEAQHFKITAGNLTLNKEVFDLNEFIEARIEEAQVATSNHTILFELLCRPL
ncbi:PAS domain-containing protein [Olivibacter sitiensis]|uniref:PAS domain-containing protein n=1 Tax=Olivibacter sitiensis TaxID=376470 RepID=UPI0004231F88|nr:PAS domain-containing protein [Olivibacter sitiensis]